MKYKVINTAVCDARDVCEESLSGFEKITVNTAVLLTNPRARELLNRYPVVFRKGKISGCRRRTANMSSDRKRMGRGSVWWSTGK